MSMTNSELKKAFREAAAYEFKDIPQREDEINFVFSETFLKKMEKLISSEKKKIWHLTNTSLKRVIAIVAIISLLLASTMSVTAIRKPVVHFFTEIYETFSQYFFEGDTTEEIITEFKIQPLPKEFYQISCDRSTTGIVTKYQSTSEEMMILSQTVTEDTMLVLDAEKGDTVITNILNRETHLYQQKGFIQAIWIQDTYLMKLTYYGETLSENDIIHIIEYIS